MSSSFVPRAAQGHHQIFPGVEIFTAAGQQMLISLVELAPGAIVEEHSHPHEQMGLLIEGELEFVIGPEQRRVQPGEMWRIPGGVKHRVVAGPQGAKALDVFCPVREEYR